MCIGRFDNQHAEAHSRSSRRSTLSRSSQQHVRSAAGVRDSRVGLASFACARARTLHPLSVHCQASRDTGPNRDNSQRRFAVTYVEKSSYRGQENTASQQLYLEPPRGLYVSSRKKRESDGDCRDSQTAQCGYLLPEFPGRAEDIYERDKESDDTHIHGQLIRSPKRFSNL